MATPLPTSWSEPADWSRPALFAIGGAFACGAAAALLAPAWFWLPLGIAAVAALGIAAFRHVVAVCVA